MVACTQLHSALWVWFLALSWFLSAVLANFTNPAIIEFDGVFPRNDTYAPVNLMPIVLAVQDSSIAWSLGFVVTWAIDRARDRSQFILLDSGRIDLAFADYSESDPYYVVDYTKLKNTEGVYRMTWALDANYCNMSSNHAAVNNVTFTIKKGAKKFDLVASTGADSCATIPSTTFSEQNFRPCPVLGGVANPCALKINEDRASRIAAAVTASACTPMNTGDCPESKGAGRATSLLFNRPITRVGGLMLFVAFFVLVYIF